MPCSGSSIPDPSNIILVKLSVCVGVCVGVGVCVCVCVCVYVLGRSQKFPAYVFFDRLNNNTKL